LACLLAYLGSIAGILLGLATLFSVIFSPTVQPTPVQHVTAARIRPQSATSRHTEPLSPGRVEKRSSAQAGSEHARRERKRVARAYVRQKLHQAILRNGTDKWVYRSGLAHRDRYALEPWGAHLFW
jgi:hypothetical protein